MQPRLEIEFLRDDPAKIWVKASNETFAGETEHYINAQMLEKLAEQLSLFPQSNSDKVTFKVGDIDSHYGHCELKFHCFDSAGHTAVLVSVSNDRACIAKFVVQFEALSLDAFVASMKLALKSGSGVSELIGIKPYTQNV
ncbi:hypothetical protein SIO17_23285 [Pseudoalteromonas piscicida]|uniref:Uncharacterized protein n=1 Tax=Pseudoalteromonas piscicida TaxID=43662 RepID=A0ABN5CKC8_PSEO7|nr:hypothetical protein [Pseudoalteromonas piscicida]ATD10075.1 hypothetical protein PPIS_b1045 [Pseudoalteromonas piscicida]MDP4486406.1 hypothetical protein [Pseudoalteromonas piscicida]WPU31936.1 hypothetical protein SIO17_23285 [Pseudoalteromonas piscicida]